VRNLRAFAINLGLLCVGPWAINYARAETWEFTFTGDVVTWTAPYSTTCDFEAFGASGGQGTYGNPVATGLRSTCASPSPKARC
jgi:hypothetical protein